MYIVGVNEMKQYEDDVFKIIDENSSVKPSKQIRKYVKGLKIDDSEEFNKIYQKLYNQHYRQIKKGDLRKYHKDYRKRNRDELLKYSKDYYRKKLNP